MVALDSIGAYDLIGGGRSGGEIRRILFDTNVAIDIERFFFNDNSSRSYGLDKFLKTFPPSLGVDLNFGPAVAESCAPRTGGFDMERAERMVYALDRVTSWDRGAVDRNFSNRHAPCNRDKALRKSLPRADGVDEIDFHWLISPVYANMLYLQKLISTKSRWKQEPLKAMGEYFDWATSTLEIVGSYETVLVSGYIGGNAQHLDMVHRLLKYRESDGGDRRADKAWNAAWDVLMVRMVDGFNEGLFGSKVARKKTVLASRNIDPAMIGRLTRVEAVVGNFPLMPIELGPDKRSVGVQIEKMLEHIPLDSWKRMSRSDGEVQKSLVDAIRDLEREGGITQVFLGDN